jgi:hypothetical protein
MSDVDTPPAESGQDEPTVLTQVQELIQKNNEALMEQMRQSTQSWLGRRDKDLLDTVSEQIKSIRQEKTEKPDWYDDPEKAVEQLLNRKQTEKAAFAKSIESKIISKMNSKYTENGKKTDLGETVASQLLEEMKTFNVDSHKDMSADRCAEFIMNKAEAKAFRELASKPKTAFDGRAPTDKALGTSDGKKTTESKPSPNITSDRAKKLAEKWGYKEDDLVKVFGPSKG